MIAIYELDELFLQVLWTGSSATRIPPTVPYTCSSFNDVLDLTTCISKRNLCNLSQTANIQPPVLRYAEVTPRACARIRFCALFLVNKLWSMKLQFYLRRTGAPVCSFLTTVRAFYLVDVAKVFIFFKLLPTLIIMGFLTTKKSLVNLETARIDKFKTSKRRLEQAYYA